MYKIWRTVALIKDSGISMEVEALKPLIQYVCIEYADECLNLTSLSEDAYAPNSGKIPKIWSWTSKST